MKKNLDQLHFPRIGMLLTTLLVLGGLCAFLWWTRNRSDVYAQRAAAAAARGDWDQAMKLGSQADSADQGDRINALSYQKALTLLEGGDLTAAREQFLQLGEYEDAALRVLECTYGLAEQAEQAGRYDEAREGFLAATGYKDALDRADACRYALAEAALLDGDSQLAFERFLALGDYRDAAQRARAIASELTGETDQDLAVMLAQGYTAADWEKRVRLNHIHESLANRRLAAGHRHAVFITDAGTVRAAGENDQGQCDVGEWTDMAAVDAGYAHTLGLTKDGRVLAAGDNSQGQCDVDGWTDVVQIFCGPWDSYGLRADGTVLHCGFTELPTLSGWTDVITLGAGDMALFAVRKNGSLLSSHADQAKDWQGLCAVCAAGHVPTGLKEDGTLLSDSRDLSGWTDVVAIDSSATLLVGLRVDGTLLAAPLMPVSDGFLVDLRSEKNVIGLSLAGTYALVLHEDGTLTAPGASGSILDLCDAER